MAVSIALRLVAAALTGLPAPGSFNLSGIEKKTRTASQAEGTRPGD